MTSAVLIPFDRSPAIELSGNLWRKRLLPAGSINYKGRRIDFTPDYLSRLAAAFRDQAYPQVPFQLAPGDNSHTNDPERYAGQVVDLQAAPDGLWITLAATERGNRVLTENPDLGVSARIVEGYARSDGKFWPEAIQHVLGTLDPRIPQLGGWQTVDAANEAEITIDLSGTVFEDAALDAGWPALLELEARELAAAEARAAAVYRAQNDEVLLAGIAQAQQAIELSMAEHERQAAEDAQPLPKLDEDRLAILLGRAGRRSTRREVLNFAGEDEWDENGGPVTGARNCGVTDELTGLCRERYHDTSCGSVSDGETTQALTPTLRGGPRAPYRDADGRTWQDQNGKALTMLGALEAATGQRMSRESAFEGTGRRELVSPRQRRIWRDPGDEDDPGVEVPAAARAGTATLARQLGLAGPDVGEAREAARIRQAELAHAQRMATGGRAGHPDLCESPRERAERLHRPQRYVPAEGEGGIGGALVPITRG
jgi:hypothetical protein